MIYADLVVLAIIIIAGYIGMKRGFLRSVVGVFSIIISLALATWAYPIVANIINETNIDETITHAIEQSLGKEETSQEAEAKDEEKDGKLSLLPKSAKDAIEEQTNSVIDSAKTATAKTISSLAINIISILAVFLVVRLLMFIITHALKIITKLPVIRSVDKGLGAILGALSGILVVYLLLTLLTFNTALDTDHPIGKAVKDSYIASIMYDNNFIVSWISEK